MNNKDKEFNEIYESISLCSIAEKLSEKYNYNDRLKDYSNDVVIEIIQSFGYKVKYNKKENFFKITERQGNYSFYFHLSLKYRVCESMLGILDINNKYITGGSISTICKKIELENGNEKDGYIKYPSFRNYEDLKSILQVFFNLYEDFKIKVINSSNLII